MDLPRPVRKRTISHDSFVSGSPRAEKGSGLSSSKLPPSSFKGSGLQAIESERALLTKSAVFKNDELALVLNSPTSCLVRKPDGNNIALPVYSEHDTIQGTITLDPQHCAAENGQITLSVEGIFEYISPMSATKAGPTQITPGKHRHVFYQDSVVIPLSTVPEQTTRSRSALRSAVASLRRVASSERIRRPGLSRIASSEKFRSNTSLHDRSGSISSSTAVSIASCSSGSSSHPTATWSECSDSSYSSHSASPKTFKFEFELPKSRKDGDELPPSFALSNVVSAGVRGRVYSENADVKYRFRALWEALDGSGAQTQLEAPVIYRPDTDFHSLDVNSESWTEMPLKNVDGMPVDCAVTMPSPASFSRRSSLPYFVVFTTKPRSRTLAAEIMADATIAVSLVRRIGFNKVIRDLPKLPMLRTVASSAELGTNSELKRRMANIRLDTSPATIQRRNVDSQYYGCTPLSAIAGTSSSPSSPFTAGPRLLKRVAKSAPPILSSFRISRADPDQDSDIGSPISTGRSFFRSARTRPLPSTPDEDELVSFTPFQGPLPPRRGKHRQRANTQPTPPSPAKAQFEVEVAEAASSALELLHSSSKSKKKNPSSGESTPEAGTESPAPIVRHVSDSRTLHTDVSVGFPKRPKGRTPTPGSHPSLETVSALPDGLYKGNIPLHREWFPSLQWDQLNIEYFLQVSVIYDNSEFKGQVPLKIY